ncbi:MAG: NADP-dependent oxidoreductase [Rhizomicrobium sp.]
MTPRAGAAPPIRHSRPSAAGRRLLQLSGWRRRALVWMAVFPAILALAPAPAAVASEVPATMLAAALDHGGGPDVLSIHRLPVPKPLVGEVLIAVRAAGVAVWDAGERQHVAEGTHFPLVLGTDGAGTVAAIGPGVQGFKVGDRVYGVVEGMPSGFYAQYVTTPAENVAPIPKGIGFDEAGILAVSGLSALQGIDDVLQLKAGDTLIIHGASGAVGALAVQFAKLRGVKVLATVTSDAGAALVKRLGADAVVNGKTGDIAAAAKRFAPEGVDAVLGLAGGPALEQCIDALRHDRRGRVAYLDGINPIPRPRLGIRMTLYSYIPGRGEFDRLNKAVEAAHLKVPIAAEYPLAKAADAHRRLAAGHLLGKIVLLVQQG